MGTAQSVVREQQQQHHLKFKAGLKVRGVSPGGLSASCWATQSDPLHSV